MDLVMAVPGLVLAILVVAVLGPSLTNTIIAVTLVSLPRYVRWCARRRWPNWARTTSPRRAWPACGRCG
jgi:Flp pilus assembly protein TadB